MSRQLALIGFGEAGAAFAAAAGWHDRASAFDTDPARRVAMAASGVIAAQSAAGALAEARLVLSLVTADQALAAARAYAPLLAAGAIWCDMNSIAPHTKRAAAEPVGDAGARYVDVAIMAPVLPAGLKVPLLVSGEHAEEARAALLSLGFENVRCVGDEIGRASAIKLIRSVMVKGTEALTLEMMAAAEAAGVADEVLASLDASEQSKPWAERAAYNIARATAHGERRAAEMAESAVTLRSLGIEPLMTEATVRRQRDAAQTRKTKSAA